MNDDSSYFLLLRLLGVLLLLSRVLLSILSLALKLLILETGFLVCVWSEKVSSGQTECEKETNTAGTRLQGRACSTRLR